MLFVQKSGVAIGGSSESADCAKLDTFELCHMLGFALGLLKQRRGRFSPAQLLDLMVSILCKDNRKHPASTALRGSLAW